MKGLKKQRRIQIVSLSFAMIAVLFGLFYLLPADSFQFFRSPSQLLENPPAENQLLRIGGLVEDGSLKTNSDNQFIFNVTDGGATVPVTYTGILPDLFAEGEGMVGTGRYINGVFEATEILAKHDETYMPVEVIDALKAQGVYQEPNGS